MEPNSVRRRDTAYRDRPKYFWVPAYRDFRVVVKVVEGRQSFMANAAGTEWTPFPQLAHRFVWRDLKKRVASEPSLNDYLWRPVN